MHFVLPLHFDFLVERLDTPIERIEIRLIDENSTNTVLEQSSGANLSRGGGSATQLNGAATENAIDANVVGSADQYDVRYKKVYKQKSSHAVTLNPFCFPLCLPL
ncbi:unnamed protein product [Strongylus vulgaris]|uniref:Uncharacterized protein n=1 Tax=Strongylus vulgaris TaxID=40348 RepID=A0A3P7KEG5_STRVU|nr:unnamed protein product [Strongylus vulgaris]